MAATIVATQEEAKLMVTGRRQQVNWVGIYGLKIEVQAIQLYVERIVHKIHILRGSSLKIIIAGRKSNCYLCGEVVGHIRNHCTKYKLPQAEKDETKCQRVVVESEMRLRKPKSEHSDKSKCMTKGKRRKKTKETSPRKTQQLTDAQNTGRNR